MLLMIVIGVAVFGVAIASVWFVLARRAKVSETTQEDFDAAYDELVAEGKAVDGDRDAAWRDFHAWQLKNEEEHLSWEEPSEE